MREYSGAEAYFGCFLQIAFLALGLFQLAAAMAQIEALWDIPGWAAVVICVLLMILAPVVLPFFSFFGAKDVWFWEWWQALLLAAPFLLIAAVVMFSGGLGALFSRGRRG